MAMPSPSTRPTPMPRSWRCAWGCSAPKTAARAGRTWRADLQVGARARYESPENLLCLRHRLAVTAERARHRGDAALAAGVDLDRRRHAGADRRLADLRQESELHRQALHDFDPVPAGVL